MNINLCNVSKFQKKDTKEYFYIAYFVCTEDNTTVLLKRFVTRDIYDNLLVMLKDNDIIPISDVDCIIKIRNNELYVDFDYKSICNI